MNNFNIELYTAGDPVINTTPTKEAAHLLGLLIKPESQRFLTTAASKEGRYFEVVATELLNAFGFNPLVFKTIYRMQEAALLTIYKDTFKPYLDKLAASGTAKDLATRQANIDFFCKRPMTLVVASLLGNSPISEARTVELAQINRDRLRTQWGKSYHNGEKIVHRTMPGGAQFSALHAGFLREISVLLSEEDKALIRHLRPNALNLP